MMRFGLVSSFVLSSILMSTMVTAQPSLRVSVDQEGDMIVVGNTLGWDCGAGAPAPIVGTVPGGGFACGGLTGDTSPDVFWRSDDNGTTADASTMVAPAQARSQAVLTLPAGATVTHAFLYWGGDRENMNPPSDDTVTLDRPDGQGGTVFTAQVTAAAADISVVGNEYFQAVANITQLVQMQGSGAYRLSGLDVRDIRSDNKQVTFAGWTLVVFYQDPAEPSRNLTIFDGLDLIDGNTVTANLSGFMVPNAGFDAKLGVIAYEGDGQIGGDRLLFGTAPLDNSDSLSDALNPANTSSTARGRFLGRAALLSAIFPSSRAPR